MKAEVIAIGDELLLGQTIDTNSAWLGENLAVHGIRVSRVVTISDIKVDIETALDEAFSRVDLVLMTGGLGPTKDDITKQTLAEYFNSDFYTNDEVKAGIIEYFVSVGRKPLDVNLNQAILPSKADILINKRGTASGMWFNSSGKVVLSMPGVPYEMKGIMHDEGFDKIKKTFKTPSVYNKTILTIGKGESSIAKKLENWETSLRKNDLSLAYLPSVGMVRLRISGVSEDEKFIKNKIDVEVNKALEYISEIVFGYDNDKLEVLVGDMLLKCNKTLSLAESCTGGYMSHLITSVPGSSEYYEGSAVTYSYNAKENLVGVNHSDLMAYGAVSETVVKQMASGVRKKFNTDYGISASGIAGPGGGTKDKPVGTVWIGLATPEKVEAFKFNFGKSRARNIIMTANAALNILRKELLHIAVGN